MVTLNSEFFFSQAMMALQKGRPGARKVQRGPLFSVLKKGS